MLAVGRKAVGWRVFGGWWQGSFDYDERGDNGPCLGVTAGVPIREL